MRRNARAFLILAGTLALLNPPPLARAQPTSEKDPILDRPDRIKTPAHPDLLNLPRSEPNGKGGTLNIPVLSSENVLVKDRYVLKYFDELLQTKYASRLNEPAFTELAQKLRHLLDRVTFPRFTHDSEVQRETQLFVSQELNAIATIKNGYQDAAWMVLMRLATEEPEGATASNFRLVDDGEHLFRYLFLDQITKIKNEYQLRYFKIALNYALRLGAARQYNLTTTDPWTRESVRDAITRIGWISKDTNLGFLANVRDLSDVSMDEFILPRISGFCSRLLKRLHGP